MSDSLSQTRLGSKVATTLFEGRTELLEPVRVDRSGVSFSLVAFDANTVEFDATGHDRTGEHEFRLNWRLVDKEGDVEAGTVGDRVWRHASGQSWGMAEATQVWGNPRDDSAVFIPADLAEKGFNEADFKAFLDVAVSVVDEFAQSHPERMLAACLFVEANRLRRGESLREKAAAELAKIDAAIDGYRAAIVDIEEAILSLRTAPSP